VLTVKTDKGEFILDNQNENVVAWTETGYRSSSASRRAIQCVGLAWRQAAQRSPPQRPRALGRYEKTETRDPVNIPTPPVPDRIARGQLSPKGWPHPFLHCRKRCFVWAGRPPLW